MHLPVILVFICCTACLSNAIPHGDVNKNPNPLISPEGAAIHGHHGGPHDPHAHHLEPCLEGPHGPHGPHSGLLGLFPGLLGLFPGLHEHHPEFHGHHPGLHGHHPGLHGPHGPHEIFLPHSEVCPNCGGHHGHGFPHEVCHDQLGPHGIHGPHGPLGHGGFGNNFGYPVGFVGPHGIPHGGFHGPHGDCIHGPHGVHGGGLLGPHGGGLLGPHGGGLLGPHGGGLLGPHGGGLLGPHGGGLFGPHGINNAEVLGILGKLFSSILFRFTKNSLLHRGTEIKELKEVKRILDHYDLESSRLLQEVDCFKNNLPVLTHDYKDHLHRYIHDAHLNLPDAERLAKGEIDQIYCEATRQANYIHEKAAALKQDFLCFITFEQQRCEHEPDPAARERCLQALPAKIQHYFHNMNANIQSWYNYLNSNIVGNQLDCVFHNLKIKVDQCAHDPICKLTHCSLWQIFDPHTISSHIMSKLVN